MPSRKKVNESKTQAADVLYQNKFTQTILLVGARKTYLELGRGSAKTTEAIVSTLIELIYEMPGAPIVWVADTFANLTANILPSVFEGLERKMFHEGTHYVVEKAPPEFTDKEKEDLPDWLRPHFWKPANHIVSYKRTIVFFTGLNISFGSMDRPSTLAGRSWVFVFGDEGKYFRPEQLANLLKAVRGYPQYKHCPHYRGQMFTSDVADPSHVGEHDWMKHQAKNMNKEAILLVLRAGLVFHEAMREAIAAKDTWLKTKSPSDLKTYENKLRTASRWRERWIRARMQPEADVFYFRASSYINADILGADWFQDAISSGLPDTNTAILSMDSTLSSGDMFYPALSEYHFYSDSINEEEYDKLSLTETATCRVLKHCDLSAPLRIGVDFGGRMNSMTIAQMQKEKGSFRDIMRVIKFLYTLSPEYISDLGAKFRQFFAPMKNRVVYMYYDRAGNANKAVKKDSAGELKAAIEYDENGHPTGWAVHLMSRGQGDIYQSEEFHFMQILMSESNPLLPLLRIDMRAARELKNSLERARLVIKNHVVHKDKSTERLELSRLPNESTNPSDSLKYLLMTKDWRKVVKRGPTVAPGNIDITTTPPSQP